MNGGCVYLVGAGPGDAGLVTQRALEVLRIADVVIFDRLIPMQLLDHVPNSSLRIDAGKKAGDHTMTQSEINAAIVRHALAGKTVVRLKGGDPLLFGRGGEEAIACRNERIPFEFVPGITSAFSVPMYAGIPVTHRGVAQHVTVVTAAPGDVSQEPNYEWLAASEGTVVFLMSLKRVPIIAERLQQHGRKAETPVAVISHGATALQRTVVGTLEDIANRVDEATLTAPALVVVGEVVALRESLAWFEERPLFGRTIAVTRARAQASSLSETLRRMGAAVVEVPSIRIEPLDTNQLDHEIAALQARDLLVFTSVNAANIFFDRLSALGLDARVLAGTKVCVVGAGTNKACQAFGITADVVPPAGKRTAAGLLETLLAGEAADRKSALVVRAETGDDRLIDGLRQSGIAVTLACVYRTVVDMPPAALARAASRADFVTFTAASTVRNFFECLPPDSELPAAISIGPVTSEAAREYGFNISAESREPSIESLVVAIVEHCERAEVVGA